MSRARNIKPAFFKNEELVDAPIGARLLFVGLWTLADRNGLLEKRPRRIKAEIFPYEPKIDVNGYITVLERLEFIQTLTDGKIEFLYIKNFTKHQNPHHTEKTVLPLPNTLKTFINGDVTVKQRLDNGDNPADSLTLIPDSLTLIPDSLIPILGEQGSPNKCTTNFELWWKVYKKGNKFPCQKRWKAMKLESNIDEIMEGTNKYLKSKTVIDGYKLDGQNFLKNRVWEDKFEQQKEERAF